MTPSVYVINVKNLNPQAYRDNMDGHRAWVNKHADAFFVLCGPFEDRSKGGMIIAQAESREALDRVLSQDPLLACGAAAHEVEMLEISRGYLKEQLRPLPVPGTPEIPPGHEVRRR